LQHHHGYITMKTLNPALSYFRFVCNRFVCSRTPLRVTLLLVGILLSAGVSAKDYQVEVVLFQNVRVGPSPGASLYIPRLGNAIGLKGDKAQEMRFQLIDEPDMLIDYADSIRASGDYRLLSHFAWRQPGLDGRSTRPIRINVGKAIKVFIPQEYGQYDRFVPASLQPRFADGSREITTTSLSGVLKLRLGRFLHLDTRMVFTDLEAGRSYRLDHSRKMRSRELHYIDNPKFGMLVRIIPLDDT